MEKERLQVERGDKWAQSFAVEPNFIVFFFNDLSTGSLFVLSFHHCHIKGIQF